MAVFDAEALAAVGLRHAERPERGLVGPLPGPVSHVVAIEHLLGYHRRSGAPHGPLIDLLVERLADREGMGLPLGLSVASAQVREIAPLEVGLLGWRQGREEVHHARRLPGWNEARQTSGAVRWEGHDARRAHPGAGAYRTGPGRRAEPPLRAGAVRPGAGARRSGPGAHRPASGGRGRHRLGGQEHAAAGPGDGGALEVAGGGVRRLRARRGPERGRAGRALPAGARGGAAPVPGGTGVAPAARRGVPRGLAPARPHAL